MRKLITFDWAIKHILRNKANFDILEGFLSELLKQAIHIKDILESEANKETEDDKFNRVDLLVEDKQGRHILIEIQYDREWDYLQRIFYGAAKLATEYLDEGEPYANIKKSISVSIVYFDLGQGKDYVYHGQTEFYGVHQGDKLELNETERILYRNGTVASLYPEYYLVKVKQFDDMLRDRFDEWVYFLKHEEIKDDFEAQGIKKAKETLDVLKLSDEKRRAYRRYLDNLHYQASMTESSYKLGKIEGELSGVKQGRQTERTEIAKKLLEQGVAYETIILATGLSSSELESLAQKINE